MGIESARALFWPGDDDTGVACGAGVSLLIWALPLLLLLNMNFMQPSTHSLSTFEPVGTFANRSLYLARNILASAEILFLEACVLSEVISVLLAKNSLTSANSGFSASCSTPNALRRIFNVQLLGIRS